jgi:hypothetical protein
VGIGGFVFSRPFRCAIEQGFLDGILKPWACHHVSVALLEVRIGEKSFLEVHTIFTLRRLGWLKRPLRILPRKARVISFRSGLACVGWANFGPAGLGGSWEGNWISSVIKGITALMLSLSHSHPFTLVSSVVRPLIDHGLFEGATAF